MARRAGRDSVYSAGGRESNLTSLMRHRVQQENGKASSSAAAFHSVTEPCFSSLNQPKIETNTAEKNGNREKHRGRASREICSQTKSRKEGWKGGDKGRRQRSAGVCRSLQGRRPVPGRGLQKCSEEIKRSRDSERKRKPDRDRRDTHRQTCR